MYCKQIPLSLDFFHNETPVNTNYFLKNLDVMFLKKVYLCQNYDKIIS